MQRTLAAVFAHPDDETFSVGGTIRRASIAGADCHLYCATSGGAGRSSGVPVQSRAELEALRRAELLTAAHLLGFLGVRTGDYDDGALASADADVLVGEIVDFLRAHRPQVVITFGPEGARNGHADHRAISRAATAAFFLARLPTAYPEQLGPGRLPHAPSRLYYVTWTKPTAGESLQLEGLPIAARVDVARFLDAKRTAFLVHVTQHDHRDRFEELALTQYECFALAAGVPQPAPVIEDLFQGL